MKKNNKFSTGKKEHPRAWQRMLSGRKLDLLNPSPADIEIEDIAHGLARVARWNGQTVGENAYSVAQHSVLVMNIANSISNDLPNEWQLAALLHDSAEYVIGDLISPFKAAIGLDYRAFEKLLMEAIHERFGLQKTRPAPLTNLIKRADTIAAYYEATVLAGFDRQEALQYFGDPEKLGYKIINRSTKLNPWTVAFAQEKFLQKFWQLGVG